MKLKQSKRAAATSGSSNKAKKCLPIPRDVDVANTLEEMENQAEEEVRQEQNVTMMWAKEVAER